MKGLLKNTHKHKWLVVMALPALIILFMFNYLPMFGLFAAFKEFTYDKSIFKSAWVGFDNFKMLFAVKETMWRLLRNTVGYWALTATWFL